MIELTAASASAFTQANLRQKIDIAVQKEAQDAQKVQGAGVLRLLDSAAGFVSALRGAISPVPGAGETGSVLDLKA